jgi:hypothetical protein
MLQPQQTGPKRKIVSSLAFDPIQALNGLDVPYLHRVLLVIYFTQSNNSKGNIIQKHPDPDTSRNHVK